MLCPPIFFGPKMQGTIGGFFRQFIDGTELRNSNGADADLFGVRGTINY